MEYKNISTMPVISEYKPQMTDGELKDFALQLRRDIIEITRFSGTKSSHGRRARGGNYSGAVWHGAEPAAGGNRSGTEGTVCHVERSLLCGAVCGYGARRGCFGRRGCE